MAEDLDVHIYKEPDSLPGRFQGSQVPISLARTHARMLTSCCGDGCTYRGRVGRQEGPGKGWYSDPPVGVLSGPAALCLHAALHPLYQAQRQEVAHGLQLRVPTLST
jgi:hypothetical protein